MPMTENGVKNSIVWATALVLVLSGFSATAAVQAHNNQVQRTQQIEACADAEYSADECMDFLRGYK